MAEFRIITVQTWPTEIMPINDLHGRYIASYLRICSHTNMIGAFYIPMILISHETLIPLESVEVGLNILAKHRFAFYDKKTEQVYVPSLARDNAGRSMKPNDNKLKAAQKFYDRLRPSYICDIFWNDFGAAYGLRKRPDAGMIPMPEEDLDQTIEAPKSGFTPPTNGSAPQTPPHKGDVPEIEIPSLLERYSPEEQDSIKQVFELLKLTRKCGKIADSIILTELRRWSTLDVRRVIYALRTYISTGHATQKTKGKDISGAS